MITISPVTIVLGELIQFITQKLDLSSLHVSRFVCQSLLLAFYTVHGRYFHLRYI